jgi:signal transduction histidine kinase
MCYFVPKPVYTIPPMSAANSQLVPLIDLREETRTREELAEALDFRDRVMGILGHDLRNPLSAISALAISTMGRDDLPNGVRERLAQMDRAAKRSLAMIATLLDFSESRFNRSLTMRPVLARPADIAQRVIEELSAANPDRQITLHAESRESVQLDPARVEQVLSNLIGNALVHGARDSAVDVWIDVHAEAILRVRNRGPVIPADAIPTLFEPFTRGASNGDRSRGLGLGLYIVRHIVAAHRGTISVESNADFGTTFTVRLPR